VFCSLVRETVSPHTYIQRGIGKCFIVDLPLCRGVGLQCSSTVLGTGSGVVAAGDRAASVRAPGSRRPEVRRRRCRLWGRGDRRSGDVGAGSGVAAVGGRATSARAPGSR
jgi:hypothetical protein